MIFIDMDDTTDMLILHYNCWEQQTPDDVDTMMIMSMMMDTMMQMVTGYIMLMNSGKKIPL